MTKNFILYTLIFVVHFHVLSQQKKSYFGIDYVPTIATQLSPVIEQNNPLRFSSSFGINLNHELSRNKVYLEYGFYSIDRGYGYTVDVFNEGGDLFGKYRKKEHFICLSVPLKIGFKFNDIYLDFGPSFDYIYAKRTKHNKTVIDKTISNETNRILFGGNLSFGTSIVPGYKKGIIINVGAYSNITFKPMFLNAGIKFGIKFRLK